MTTQSIPVGTSAPPAFDSPFVDKLLLLAFRFRTRGFLRMKDVAGTVPPIPSEGAGYLYVHIPFCEVLCPFCSFHRVQHKHGLAQQYFALLRDEIRLYHVAGHRFTGVYFGGGTPTCEPDELIETIGLVRKLYGVREVSVETNPNDLRPELLARLRDAGVTRLSIGVQSFDDGLLRDMDRHDKYGSSAMVQENIRVAAGYFPTVNVDLIFNLPHQTLEMLERDITIFLSLGANQVSFYPLMTSPTVTGRMSHTMGLPDRRSRGLFYATILAKLRPEFTASSAWCFTRKGHGLDEYIIEADHYIGVGSGAFSYVDGTLYTTTFSLKHYGRRIAQGLTGITTARRLSLGDQFRYILLMRMFGLRLDRQWVKQRHGSRFFRRLWGELLTLELAGAAKRDVQGWTLTDRGMYWMMLMMSAFFESVNSYRDAMRAHIRDELEEISTMSLPVNRATGVTK